MHAEKYRGAWAIAGLGLVLWVPLELARDASTDLAAIERLLAGLLLVAAPLLLGRTGPRARPSQVFVAGLAAAGSCWLEPGWAAALATCPWLILGLAELGSAARRGWATPRDPTLGLRTVGRLFLAAGGGWLVFGRAGGTLPGLSEETVRLAAVHAHATGFAGLTLMSLAAATAPARTARLLAACGAALGLGFACTGVGIASLHALEPVGAALLVLALSGYAALGLPGLSRVGGRLPRLLLGLSSLALLVGLALGLIHALRHASSLAPAFTRADMISLHGTALLIFAVAGGLGFAAAPDVSAG